MIFNIQQLLIFMLLTVSIESRSVLISHKNSSDVKHFEPILDPTIGYWSPSTSSIDWCERNYAVTKYIAEFWNCISSFIMCIFAAMLVIQGLYYQIENRFIILSLSFGLVGLGSAYFHGTLTLYGQMADELPMVYSMIIWWFVLFRMDKFQKFNSTISTFDILLLFGIFYGLLCTYIHSLKTFVVVFQLHITFMVIGAIIKLVYLYQKTQYQTNSIMYLIAFYVVLFIPALTCWLIDQHLCIQMNSIGGFNPQLHAWWHVISAIDCHVGIVCGQAMRYLSIKYREYQLKNDKSSREIFRPEDHLHIIFYFGLPFVDYSKDSQIKEIKNQ